jgi:hypothetical protein
VKVDAMLRDALVRVLKVMINIAIIKRDLLRSLPVSFATHSPIII